MQKTVYSVPVFVLVPIIAIKSAHSYTIHVSSTRSAIDFNTQG
jgi:hypothetical protein